MKILRNFCVKLIRLYQTGISPLKPQCCRFHPVCSEYARQAFLKHGFFWGLVLSVYRILRCNPLCKPGFDPVPDELTFLFKLNIFLPKNQKSRDEQCSSAETAMLSAGEHCSPLQQNSNNKN